VLGLPVSPAQLSQLSAAMPTPQQLNDVFGILQQVQQRMLAPTDQRHQSISAVLNFGQQVAGMAGQLTADDSSADAQPGQQPAPGQPAQPTDAQLGQAPAEPAGPGAGLLAGQPPAAAAAVPAAGQQAPQDRVSILVDQDTGAQYQMRASDYADVLESGHVFVTPAGGKLRVLQSDPLSDAEGKLVAAGADERQLGEPVNPDQG
jgi:hypothetical protein